jgi:DNA-binding NarL/FixJ family response regulator
MAGENVVELKAKNETLEAKNEALQAKNKALELQSRIEKMEIREKINNKANWHKRGNKPWKKEVVRSHKNNGYSDEVIADLYNITPQTVKAYSDKK